MRTPLKVTEGGSFFPSVAIASVTVKLRFSAPQDFTGTVLLPLNSETRVSSSYFFLFFEHIPIFSYF